MSTSTSSASGSTVTVADDVWMRPWLSVTGTRCTRCGPPSCFMRLHTLSPFSRNVTSLNPPMSDAAAPSTSSFHPIRRRVALVHAEQVACEQVGLLAALGTADLDDDVLLVVGVTRQQQLAELVLQPFEVGLGLGGFGAHRLAVVARAPRRASRARPRDRLAGRGTRGSARRSRRGPCAASRRAEADRDRRAPQGRPARPRLQRTRPRGRRGDRARRPGYGETATISAGSTSRLGHPPRHRVHVSLGEGEQQPGRGIEASRASAAKGTTSRSMPDRAHDDHGSTGARRRRSPPRDRARCGRRRRPAAPRRRARRAPTRDGSASSR